MQALDISAVHPARHSDPYAKNEKGTKVLRSVPAGYNVARTFSLVLKAGKIRNNRRAERGGGGKVKTFDVEVETEGEYWMLFRGFLTLSREVGAGRMARERGKGFGSHYGERGGEESKKESKKERKERKRKNKNMKGEGGEEETRPLSPKTKKKKSNSWFNKQPIVTSSEEEEDNDDGDGGANRPKVPRVSERVSERAECNEQNATSGGGKGSWWDGGEPHTSRKLT